MIAWCMMVCGAALSALGLAWTACAMEEPVDPESMTRQAPISVWLEALLFYGGVVLGLCGLFLLRNDSTCSKRGSPHPDRDRHD